jgi:hypothetical protein
MDLVNFMGLTHTTMRRPVRIDKDTLVQLIDGRGEVRLNPAVTEALWRGVDHEPSGKVYVSQTKGALDGVVLGVYTLEMPSLLHGKIQEKARENAQSWEAAAEQMIINYALSDLARSQRRI